MKILTYTSPATGHLFPIMPTLLELRNRGHEVVVRTLSSTVAAVEQQGLSAAAIDPRIEAIEHDDYRGRTPVAKMKRSLAKFLERAPIEFEDLPATIERERPDALLVDAMCWGGHAAAEVSGLPWAQWFPFPMPLRSKDAPPFGPGLAPAGGAAGRLRDRLLGPPLARSYAKAFLPQLNAFREGVGAGRLGSSDELFTSPPLTLYLTAEPFEYPRSDWPAQIQMVGPGAWDPPAEAPAWLDSIDRPIVLVNTSSEFQDDGRLAEVALEALADQDVFIVATLPSAAPPKRVPENARVERFVPHSPILERAAAVITHGGAGATQKALAAGVPVCVVPFGRDQLEVARRVEHCGAGTRLPMHRLNPSRLRDAVGRAREMRAGAEEIAVAFADAGGAPRAADLFESHCQSLGTLVRA